jgi:predicted MFS family arabinose efflux permease
MSRTFTLQTTTAERSAPEANGRPGLVTLLLACAAGLVAANLYYNQPLLTLIASTRGLEPASVAWITIGTQLGYGGGMLFLVPLGDQIDRKRLMIWTVLCSAVALAVFPFAPNVSSFLLISFLIGLLSATPQLAVPYAAGMAPAGKRGHVVGLVMSGLLIGILLSRSFSGFLAAHSSWQMVFWIAAMLMVGLAFLLAGVLPRQKPSAQSSSYLHLLASLPGLLVQEPLLRRQSFLGALGFCCFSVFWTTLTFYLSSLPAHYGSDVIGGFGILAVTGALVAPIAGRLAERYSPGLINAFFLTAVLVAFIIMWFSDLHPLSLIGLGVLILDAGVQGNQITNQTRMYSLPAELHSRLNSVYMVIYFIGGALGSLVGSVVWKHFGWHGVCLLGAGLAGVGVAFSLFAAIRTSRST